MQTQGQVAAAVVPVPNKVLVCVKCGGRLAADKTPVASERGFIYRQRVCLSCGAITSTKQGPEEVCGVEEGESVKQ